MKIWKHVLYAIDDVEAHKLDRALLHALIAIDGTSKRLYPHSTKVATRYVNCLRKYYWLIEPMLVAGLDLVETRFTNIQLRKNSAPDFAEVVYEILRCAHAHGDEIPSAFSLSPTVGGFNSEWAFGKNELHMPDRVLWALLSVAVFSTVNRHEQTSGSYYLSLGGEQFPIRDWWGREDDFRPIADRYNKVRVKLDGLERLQEPKGDGTDHTEQLLILNPPFM
jgi:hypothetical protein